MALTVMVDVGTAEPLRSRSGQPQRPKKRMHRALSTTTSVRRDSLVNKEVWPLITVVTTIDVVVGCPLFTVVVARLVAGPASLLAQ